MRTSSSHILNRYAGRRSIPYGKLSDNPGRSLKRIKVLGEGGGGREGFVMAKVIL